MLHWLGHILGLDDAAGAWYLWWSGAGSDLGELGIAGALIATYRRHTCHVGSPRFCWRLGTHPIDGTVYRACGRHHPTVSGRLTAEDLAILHRDGDC